jgi:hypothetical protein
VAKKPRKPAPKSASKPRTRSSSKGSSGRGRKAAPIETAHAKRVRRYLEKHPGATKREARGHRPDEHRTRRERATKLGRLTETERATIKRFARRQAKRGGVDAEATYRDMVRWASREEGAGYGGFVKLKAAVERLRKRGKTNIRAVTKNGVTTLVGDTRRRSGNIDIMEAFTQANDIPDAFWLYYH